MRKREFRARNFAFLLAAAPFLSALSHPAPAAAQASVLKLNALTPAQARGIGVRNVIVMIPDGMGSAHATLGRWYKFAKTGVNRLAFDDLACGMVRTYWSTGLITDSAPAASAMATGYKTSYGAIGLRPAKTAMPDLPELLPGDESTPVASVLEAARLQGRSTGLVVTSEIPHATPAGFSAHYIKRGALELLAEQQVYQGLDVVLGGGRHFFESSSRKDRQDLVKVLRERGYTYVTDRDALRAAKPGKIWGVFAYDGLERDLDRDPRVEPSLAEMTLKALDILNRNSKGFFLMVEGSQIDWGAHANDPIGTADEILAFDQAVQAVLDFARRDGNTAVLISADHSTGGLSIGTPEIGDMPVARFAEVVLKAKSTPTKVAQRLTEGSEPSLDEARGMIAGLLGLTDLKPEESAALAAGLKERSLKKIELLLGRAISRRAGIGWVFTGHGGEDVTFYCLHPRDLRIGGVIQNTDLAFYASRLLEANLGLATGRLFAPAGRAFAAAGAAVSIDAADPDHPVFQAVKAGRVLRLAVNRSLAELNGRTVPLEGVVVCTAQIPGPAALDPDKWFVPRAAIDLLK